MKILKWLFDSVRTKKNKSDLPKNDAVMTIMVSELRSSRTFNEARILLQKRIEDRVKDEKYKGTEIDRGNDHNREFILHRDPDKTPEELRGSEIQDILNDGKRPKNVVVMNVLSKEELRKFLYQDKTNIAIIL